VADAVEVCFYEMCVADGVPVMEADMLAGLLEL